MPKKEKDNSSRNSQAAEKAAEDMMEVGEPVPTEADERFSQVMDRVVALRRELGGSKDQHDRG